MRRRLSLSRKKIERFRPCLSLSRKKIERFHPCFSLSRKKIERFRPCFSLSRKKNERFGPCLNLSRKIVISLKRKWSMMNYDNKLEMIIRYNLLIMANNKSYHIISQKYNLKLIFHIWNRFSHCWSRHTNISTKCKYFSYKKIQM